MVDTRSRTSRLTSSRSRIARVVLRYHDVSPDYLDDQVTDGVSMPARVWRATLHGLTNATPPIDTGVISAPTLIVWGARDELLTRADATALAYAIPGARLLVYPDAGHLLLWEQPAQVAADLIHSSVNLEKLPR